MKLQSVKADVADAEGIARSTVISHPNKGNHLLGVEGGLTTPGWGLKVSERNLDIRAWRNDGLWVCATTRGAMT